MVSLGSSLIKVRGDLRAPPCHEREIQLASSTACFNGAISRRLATRMAMAPLISDTSTGPTQQRGMPLDTARVLGDGGVMAGPAPCARQTVIAKEGLLSDPGLQAQR